MTNMSPRNGRSVTSSHLAKGALGILDVYMRFIGL